MFAASRGTREPGQSSSSQDEEAGPPGWLGPDSHPHDTEPVVFLIMQE